MNAVVSLSFAFLKIAKSGDALINVSSVLSRLALPGSAVYAASKTFVNSFTESLWYEYKDKGIYIMSLQPGRTKTDFHNIALGDKENIVKLKQLSESSPSTIKKLIDGYNIYNLMLFYFAHLYISSSNFQVFLLISSVVIYIISYIVFYNIRKRS